MLAKIRAQTWETESFWTDRVGRYLQGTYSPQKAMAARAMFVAVEEKKLIGFVAGHRTTRFKCDGELQWIDVDEDHRGRGIGYALMGRIGTWFVDQGATRICVNVDPANVPARVLYARCGARPLNEQWMIWDDARKICPWDQE